jgi:hypothetical protein
MDASTSSSGRVRLAEIVGALSLTTDLATGWPIEHGLRRSLLAVWLGEELGLDAAELSDAYCVALLGHQSHRCCDFGAEEFRPAAGLARRTP